MLLFIAVPLLLAIVLIEGNYDYSYYVIGTAPLVIMMVVYALTGRLPRLPNLPRRQVRQ